MTPAPAAPVAAGRGDRLRSLLDAAGFTAGGVRAAVGAAGGALVAADTVATRRASLAAHVTPVATLASLLVVGDPVELEEAERRLGALVGCLIDCGLAVERGALLEPTVRLIPHDHLLVASDLPVSGAGSPDHVIGVQGPSDRLARLIVRRPVRRAVDIGTGGGVIALLLAPIAGRVVATDVNERALAFGAFNAAINGVRNIEFRLGSLFEPLAGERFGLIATNPPFVISPETAMVFRDAGLERDAISERVVRGLPDHLEPGGTATALVCWDATGADAHARPLEWAAAGACDGLVLANVILSAEVAAASWTRGAPAPARTAARWLDHYRRLGIEQLGFGAVVLRRPTDGRPGVVRTAVVGDDIGQASAQLERMLAAPVALAAAARLRLVDDAHLDGLDLVLRGGLRFRATLDVDAAAVVARLDGTVTVAEVAPAAAMPLLRRLVELGFAELVGDPPVVRSAGTLG
jgi:methylase of polypeptide subunit release factors